MKLIKHLGFEVTSNVEISEEKKAIVRKRIKTGTPEDMSSWKEARKGFTFKGKS